MAYFSFKDELKGQKISNPRRWAISLGSIENSHYDSSTLQFFGKILIDRLMHQWLGSAGATSRLLSSDTTAQVRRSKLQAWRGDSYLSSEREVPVLDLLGKSSRQERSSSNLNKAEGTPAI